MGERQAQGAARGRQSRRSRGLPWSGARRGPRGHLQPVVLSFQQVHLQLRQERGGLEPRPPGPAAPPRPGAPPRPLPAAPPRGPAAPPGTDLHVVHGLPQLVQLVGRVEGFQADVRELHLLLPQLGAQLGHLLLGLLLLAALEQAGVGARGSGAPGRRQGAAGVRR